MTPTRPYTKRRTNYERFMAFVEKTETCWLWRGARLGGRTKAYGTFKASEPRKNWYCHRWIFTHENGHIPDGLVIRHKCDTPLCVNPDHMELGTQQDNIRDMMERGRS